MLGFFIQFQNVLHGHPLACHQTLTPHPHLSPHPKELESWGSIEHLKFHMILHEKCLARGFQHVDLFPRMGDVQITFGILICYFVQHPLYLL